VELKGLFLFLQEPVTCLYPEPDLSGPQLSIIFLEY